MHPRLLADTESARTAECDASSFGRRTHRSGKDTVEHPRNGHDDYANVVCGVLSLLASPAFEQPNELASPIIVSGGAITPCGAGGVESSNGEQHETSKAESQHVQARL